MWAPWLKPSSSDDPCRSERDFRKGEVVFGVYAELRLRVGEGFCVGFLGSQHTYLLGVSLATNSSEGRLLSASDWNGFATTWAMVRWFPARPRCGKPVLDRRNRLKCGGPADRGEFFPLELAFTIRKVGLKMLSSHGSIGIGRRSGFPSGFGSVWLPVAAAHTFSEAQVLDWTITKPDGAKEGKFIRGFLGGLSQTALTR